MIKDMGKTQKAIVVEVILGRRLLSTILTVYTPTLLLNIIGHSTNFFKDFFFEAVITVNLTVMLVLVTMFISVSNNLPTTAFANYCIPIFVVSFVALYWIVGLRGANGEFKEQ